MFVGSLAQLMTGIVPLRLVVGNNRLGLNAVFVEGTMHPAQNFLHAGIGTVALHVIQQIGV